LNSQTVKILPRARKRFFLEQYEEQPEVEDNYSESATNTIQCKTKQVNDKVQICKDR